MWGAGMCGALARRLTTPALGFAGPGDGLPLVSGRCRRPALIRRIAVLGVFH